MHSCGNVSSVVVLTCVISATSGLASEPVGQSDPANWSRFRGDDGLGISRQKGLPATWSPGDYEWNIELPGEGHASPIVWRDRLFVTSAESRKKGPNDDELQEGGELRHLFCLDPATGKERWSRTIGTNESHRHLKNSWASSTPTTDGERVYVAFADEDSYYLSAWDFDGTLVWRRNLGSFESQHGQGVSPILFEDLVIMPNDQRGPSSIVAFNKYTGQTAWSTLRDIKETSYAAPVVIRANGGPPQLVCASGAMGVTSLDPYTGEQNWATGGFPDPSRTVSSPLYAGGLIFQTCGGAGKGNVMIAVNPAVALESESERIVYTREKQMPYVPCPIAFGDLLFLWGDSGVVWCADLKTGRDVWTQRVGGMYSGSPVCIDGRLYILSEEGDAVVIAASDEYELLGRTSLGDRSHSTPVVAGDRLFLRTFHRLACLRSEAE